MNDRMSLKIDRKSKTIDIYGRGFYTKQDPYWIAFDRFNTEAKLFDWVRQLSGKVWFDEELEEKLISAYEKLHGQKTQI